MIKEHTSDANSNPTGNYKIGFSALPDKRIVDLRAGNSRALVFQHKSQVKSVQAAKDAEKEMHQAFDRFRIKDRPMAGTEWFYVDPNSFYNFEQTYIKIANKYKSESLAYLSEYAFFQYSLDEARKENEKALYE